MSRVLLPKDLRAVGALTSPISALITLVSVGIAVGMLLASLTHAGLATLTHTPSPMGFLSYILGRPPSERPYVVIPVGYPADDATVPVITRKPLEEILLEIPAPPG